MKIVERVGLLIDVFDIAYNDGYYYLAGTWRDPVDGESMRFGVIRLKPGEDLTGSIEYLISGKEAYKIKISDQFLVVSGTGLWVYKRRNHEFIPLSEEEGNLVVDIELIDNLILAVVGSVFSTYLVVYELTSTGIYEAGIFFDVNMSGVFNLGNGFVAVRSGSDLLILDISDPSNIVQVERYEDIGVLVTAGANGVTVLKKENDLKLYKFPGKKYVGMVKDVGDVVATHLDGYNLYVVKNNGDIIKFAPGDDRFLFHVDGFPTSVYENNGVIVVGFEKEGVLVCKDGKVRWMRYFNPWYGVSDDNRLILSTVEGVIQLDISDPGKPTEIDRVKGFWAWHLDQKDEFIYVGGIWSSRGGVDIIREFFKGRILYNGIVILKREGDLLKEVKRIKLPETKSSFTTYDIYIKDQLLFAASDAGLVVMNISSPEEPEVVYVKRGIHIRHVWFQGNDVYVHLYPLGDVIQYTVDGNDVREKGIIRDVGYMKLGYNVFGGQSGLRYISVTDGTLKVIGGIDIGIVEDGTTDGNRLYVSTYHEDTYKLWIIDGSNVESYETNHLRNLIYKDGYLYASAQVSGKSWDLVKYDVTNGLKEIERIKNMGDIFHRVMVVRDYIYLLDGRRGIAILEG